MQIIMLIPHYASIDDLNRLTQSMLTTGLTVIIVRRDQDPACHEAMFQLEKQGCIVLPHPGAGRGRAIREGISYCMEAYPQAQGVLTVDADGKFGMDAIQRMINAMQKNPDSLSLGVRVSQDMHHSAGGWLGFLTGIVFIVMHGRMVRDLHSGLWGIPCHHFSHFLAQRGSGARYEANALIALRRYCIPLIEVPVTAIKVIKEELIHSLARMAWMVWMLLKFISSSLISIGVELGVFALVYTHFPSRIISNVASRAASNIVARLISSIVNYTLNRRVVFQYKEQTRRWWVPMLKYYCLAAVIISFSIGLQQLFSVIHVHWFVSKFLADGILSVVSYIVQRDVVFRSKKRRKTVPSQVD